MNFYNEWDPYAASWLRQLVEDGHIPPGEVDERDINTIDPDELIRYTQCHFFAGIGGWVYALRLANWGDRRVWTGSCPCQPFSVAGNKKGASDKERNLWPVWFNLIKVVRPDTVFGEQVASAVGEKYQWLDAVSHDLEDEGYRIGSGILPACSVKAPHIRQRLWFVADTNDNGRDESMREISGGLPERTDGSSVIDGRNMADTEHNGRNRSQADTSLEGSNESGIGIPVGDDIASARGSMADPQNQRLQGRGHVEREGSENLEDESQSDIRGESGRRSKVNGIGMADPQNHGRDGRTIPVERERPKDLEDESESDIRGEPSGHGEVSNIVADNDSVGLKVEREGEIQERQNESGDDADGCGSDMADPSDKGLEGGLSGGQNEEWEAIDRHVGCSGTTGEGEPGQWDGIVWVYCKDKKIRPIKPGIQPLAYGVSARVGKLRAIGNAIVPQVAAEIIRAYMEEKGYA